MTVVSQLIGLPLDAREEIWTRVPHLANAFTPFVPEWDRADEEALAWLRNHVAQAVHPDCDGR